MVDLDDLTKLFVELSEKTKEAAANGLSRIPAPEGQDPAAFRAQAIRDTPLQMVVIGNRGEQVIVTAPAAIKTSLPDAITS